ncbi:hypothetical protein BGZ65_012869, partial [Modicella reniformis]
MRHASIQSFTVDDTPPDLFQRYSLLSRNDEFSHLRHLSITGNRLKMEEEIPSLKCLLANAPNLTSLDLESSWESLPAVYSSIVGYQTYPIDFHNDIDKPILRILPPPLDSPQSKISLQNLEQLFKVHGGRIETLLIWRDMGGSVLDALVEATQSGSRLKELTMGDIWWEDDIWSEDNIETLASITSRSELRKFRIEQFNDYN